MLLRWLSSSLCLAVCFGSGCAPEIGDDCETALDCSSQASRECDRTQPGGYCTIRGCEPGTCPDESVCVKFHPGQGQPGAEGGMSVQPERLAVTYCMAKCSSDSDCRDDDGYRCTTAAQFGDGDMEAESLDGPKQRFCSARPENVEQRDAASALVRDGAVPAVVIDPRSIASDTDSGAGDGTP